MAKLANSHEGVRDLLGRPAALVGATDAKNELGKLLEIAASGGAVAITRYGRVRAVLLSAAQYDALSSSEHGLLDDLAEQFDERVARMNTPGARRAMEALLGSSEEELGRAAVVAAGTRPRKARRTATEKHSRRVATG